MESTSEPGRIHMSEKAAMLLLEQDPTMRPYVFHRDQALIVKGKGKMSTYWLSSEPLSTYQEPEVS